MELWFSAYLENELSGRDAAEVEKHLADCLVCRAKKERMEELIFSLSELQEEVPFFLKNRLYNIPEIVEKKSGAKTIYFPKWLAAAVGTVILFLNLFYFTNIFPSVNREMHSLVSAVEKFVVKSEGWLEKVKESKELFFFTFFNKKSSEWKESGHDRSEMTGEVLDKGGKNG
jgi:hypothetical protein